MASKNSIDFVISDESINRYGYRILTEGIDVSKFEANPVAYFNHDTATPAIGKWSNIKKEQGQLKGTLEFDGKDDFAMRLYNKYKDGFMCAVSLHVIPIEERKEPTFVLSGQKYPTITKCELLEVSVVNIPGNANAIRLSMQDGKQYQLGETLRATSLQTNQNKISNMEESKKQEETIGTLKAALDKSLKLNAENLIKLHQQRGVVSEKEVDALKRLALNDYDATREMLEARSLPETPDRDKEGATLAKQLVQLHFDRGAITETERTFYEKAAESDYEGTKKVLELRQGKDAVANFVGGMTNSTSSDATNERADWTYLDYYKKDLDALNEMKAKEPEKYAKLEASFVAESKKMGVTI